MSPAAARFRADLTALTGDPPPLLGIAVSGGPDSLALLLLAAEALPGAIHAATVDHGLRAEAAEEAAFVGRVCAGLDVPHAVLRTAVAAEASLQQAARRARYAALARWADAEGLGAVATAHHLDDQAETLVMRLQRGSGTSGLAGIRADARIGGLCVVRPLLGWRRAELAAIVAAARLDPVRDPGNADDRHDRVRIRSRLAETAWLDPVPLARSAEALAEAEAALAWAAARVREERVRDQDGVRFDPSGLPAEIVRRVVLAILAKLAPGAAPRGEALTRFLAALAKGETATLAGVLGKGGRVWRFSPAPPRRPA